MVVRLGVCKGEVGCVEPGGICKENADCKGIGKSMGACYRRKCYGSLQGVNPRGSFTTAMYSSLESQMSGALCRDCDTRLNGVESNRGKQWLDTQVRWLLL